MSVADPDGVLADYHRWLYKVAIGFLPAGPRDDRLEDVVQEGRIAMWRAMETYDESLGTLAPWITRAAEARMRSVALGTGQPTGRPATRGEREVDRGPSLDSIVSEDDRDALLGYVEEAYSDGAILAALEALSPAQREYVFLRFWGGLEPTARTPEMRALVLQFPVLGQRHHWQRAKPILAEILRQVA